MDRVDLAFSSNRQDLGTGRSIRIASVYVRRSDLYLFGVSVLSTRLADASTGIHSIAIGHCNLP